MNFKDWSEELLVAILAAEEKTGLFQVDLRQVADRANLRSDEEWLVRFLNEERVFGSGIAIGDNVTFELNQNGRHQASKLRKAKESRTPVGRLKAISRSDWISFAALIVATYAAVKP